MHADDKTAYKIPGALKKFWEFFYIDGLVLHEFVSPEQNVTGHSYMQVSERLSDAVRRQQGDGNWQGQWFLHHDKAPSHTSVVVQHASTVSEWRLKDPNLSKGTGRELMPQESNLSTNGMNNGGKYRQGK
jgi:hypothetical protein